MANQLPWVRNFYQDWIMDFAGTDAAEKATYSTLTALMYRACEPIYDDTSALARIVGCSVQTFKKSLEKLIRKKLILQLEDGNLWSTQVEEELKNCNENLNRLSEKAIKAANTRKNKQKDNASKEYDASIMTSSQDHHEVMTSSSRDHDDIIMTSSRQHINNNNNSYNKKTNTIVLAKKEIDFEDLETNEQVDEPSEDHDCEKQADAIETVAEDKPAVHEQENVPKKAKRSKANRGCRLPDDFEPDYDFAITEGLPPERVKIEIAKFRDYWKAKTGKDATKIDWQATWRNWIRNSKDHKINQIGGNYGKFTPKTFTKQLAEGFSELRNHLSSREDYRNDQSGVSIDAESWEYIDETGGGKNLRCLQSSRNLALCESFG
ncbi:DUF1376 domain-containing protein [Bartonella machadoae]|uniref:DUF1376 domain-containing protein n=1 Tax=Bartonella machadoae TaxID=2893471 RepID=UPI001F4D24A1|nr:DUF1376 domain-containing protein [Bartonella machadoae]UNE54424.1 YdaU family protein [Bartonella machadoae]UNE54496.1 YdaU family protein [Bartonella machadoae]